MAKGKKPKPSDFYGSLADLGEVDGEMSPIRLNFKVEDYGEYEDRTIGPLYCEGEKESTSGEILFASLGIGHAKFYLPTCLFTDKMGIAVGVRASLDLNRKSKPDLMHFHVILLGQAGEVDADGLRFDAILDSKADRFMIRTTSKTDLKLFRRVFERLLPEQ